MAVEHFLHQGHANGHEEGERQAKGPVIQGVDDLLLVFGNWRVASVEGDAGRGLDDDDQDSQAEKQQDLQEGVRAQIGKRWEKLACEECEDDDQ